MNSLFINNLHVKQILVIAPNWRFYLSRTILGVFSTLLRKSEFEPLLRINMDSFKKQNVRQQRGTSSRSTKTATSVPKKTVFKAKTVGYESDYYMHGSVSDTANFNAVTKNLARLVSRQSWGGAVKSGKAMIDMRAPTIAWPIK